MSSYEGKRMMDIDRGKASNKLSRLDLKFSKGAFDIEMYWFRMMTVVDNWHIGRHTHSAYEFHFVAEGKSAVKTDCGEFVVEAGQFYITKPGEYHEQVNIDEIRYVEYCMHCQISLNNKVSTEDALIYKILTESECKAYEDVGGVMKLFEDALTCAYYERIGYYGQIQNYILLLLTASVQIMSEGKQYNYNVPQKHKKGDYRFTLMSQYIMDNINNPMTIKHVADYMYLSEKQVSRIIKKKTGLSTKQYINQIRLKKAKELLRDTDLLMKEIAERLGFSSEYYFNQFFKREEGYPPGFFRTNTSF